MASEGWYPDQDGSGRQRWFDGTQWTDTVRDMPIPAPSILDMGPSDQSSRLVGLSEHPPAPRTGPAARVEFPAELNKFSWGAFLMNWIWAIFHKVWIGLLAIIPIFGIPVIFYLGFKGNERAWRARPWRSIQDFQASQRKWAVAGFILTGIGFAMTVTYTVIFLVFLGAITNSAQGTSTPTQSSTPNPASSEILGAGAPPTAPPELIYAPDADDESAAINHYSSGQGVDLSGIPNDLTRATFDVYLGNLLVLRERAFCTLNTDYLGAAWIENDVRGYQGDYSAVSRMRSAHQPNCVTTQFPGLELISLDTSGKPGSIAIATVTTRTFTQLAQGVRVNERRYRVTLKQNGRWGFYSIVETT